MNGIASRGGTATWVTMTAPNSICAKAMMPRLTARSPEALMRAFQNACRKAAQRTMTKAVGLMTGQSGTGAPYAARGGWMSRAAAPPSAGRLRRAAGPQDGSRLRARPRHECRGAVRGVDEGQPRAVHAARRSRVEHHFVDQRPQRA